MLAARLTSLVRMGLGSAPSAVFQKTAALALSQAALRAATYATVAPDANESIDEFISKTIQKNPVVVFMKGVPEQPMCGFSRTVVGILELHDVPEFAAVNVLASDAVRQGIKDFTKWPTIPQVFIGGEFVGGCDIMINLHQSDELDQMLQKVNLGPLAASQQSDKK